MSRKRQRTVYHSSGISSSKNGGNFRLILLTLLILIGFALVAVKLVRLQVFLHDYYAKRAEDNINNRQVVPARRGTIYDRQGRELARDVLQYSVAVRGRFVQNKTKLYQTLSRVLGISRRTIQQKVRRHPDFVYLKHRVPANKIKPLLQLRDAGLVLEKKFLRAYPYRELAAHLVGYCDVDNRPLAGIELQYNDYLQGTPGWRIYQRDALGHQVPNLDLAGMPPIDGCDVILTIDIDYQTVLEDELKRGVEESGAPEGVALLLNPNTGELLALANYPQFDPNRASRYSEWQRKNRAIIDVVEPGSTFKIVTLSAALENLHLKLDKDIVFCENGRYRLFNRTILDHKKYGWLTVRQVIEHSSNIGVVKIARKLPSGLLYRYIRNFGFGMVTDVDLPGESAGLLRDLKDYDAFDYQYLSVGYGVGVTPLQLANAYCAVANGGRLYRPFVASEVRGLHGNVLLKNQPEVIRQVISPQTAELINSVLVGVVREGTGVKAAIPGLEIAGKTGTAQLYDEEKGAYDRHSHLASFVGYFPAHHPEFLLLVMVRNPRGVYYGGQVAAPIFRRMARRIYSLFSTREPQLTALIATESDSLSEEIPRVENLPVNTARKILEQRGYRIRLVGNGQFVSRQKVVTKNSRSKQVDLYLEKRTVQQRKRVPSLKGLTLKEALDAVNELGVEVEVQGHGIVVKQEPKPGSVLTPNKTIRIWCRPS